MRWLGVEFHSIHVDTPEDLASPLASNPAALAAALAAEKAEAARGLESDALLLSFDTIVVHDGELLGKPVDEADAWRMLRALSARKHQVVTGCAVWDPHAAAPTTFAVTTEVVMAELTDCRIAAWLALGTYLGCAGAYNIEAQVASVTLDECFQNVAGLPLCHLCSALSDPAIVAETPEGLSLPVGACNAALGRTCRLGPRIVGEA